MSGSRANSARRFAQYAAVAGALLASTTLLAQYALDANLKVGGGRRNVTTTRLPMQHDIYQINRRTGTFQYDETAAFAMPRYQPGNQNKPYRASAADTSYHRPVLTTGPDSGIFTVDRRSGTFRYNEANALSARGYQTVYQSATPPKRTTSMMEVGNATPVYQAAGPGRSARAGQVTTKVRAVPPDSVSATTLATTPVVLPADDPRTKNLKPAKYRVPTSDAWRARS